jgi:hypothetical protein
MNDFSVPLGPRGREIVELLLEGCSNREIAETLKMKQRTVKAHLNRLFMRFGVSQGIKRVKLATMLYRETSSLSRKACGTPPTESSPTKRRSQGSSATMKKAAMTMPLCVRPPKPC